MPPIKNQIKIEDQQYRQLDAIESTLTDVVSIVLCNEAANEPEHGVQDREASVAIRRTTESLELIHRHPSTNTQSHALHMTPLFVGSHSQNEIVVATRTNTSQFATYESRITLQALKPELFFAGFDKPTFNHESLMERQAINLILVLPVRAVHADLLNVGKLDEFLSVIRLASNIDILCWDDGAKPRHADNQALFAAVHTWLTRKCRSRINTVQLSPVDTAGLFNQFFHYDLALLPSTGLTMDALNARCASGQWTKPENGPDELRTFSAKQHDAPELRRNLRELAEQQRCRFVETHLESSHGNLITTRSNILLQSVDNFYSRLSNHLTEDSEKPSGRTLEFSGSETVISIELHTAHGRWATWLESTDKLHRKLRKLYLSPRQFFSDIQWPLLNRVTAQLKKKRQ